MFCLHAKHGTFVPALHCMPCESSVAEHIKPMMSLSSVWDRTTYVLRQKCSAIRVMILTLIDSHLVLGSLTPVFLQKQLRGLIWHVLNLDSYIWVRHKGNGFSTHGSTLWVWHKSLLVSHKLQYNVGWAQAITESPTTTAQCWFGTVLTVIDP